MANRGRVLYDLVLACTPQRGIGSNGRLPWSLPAEMKMFKRITTSHTHNVVIMGRKTFQSIGSRALINRLNIILSNTKLLLPQHVLQAANFKDAIALSQSLQPNSKVFVIGGKKVFEDALSEGGCRRVYETQIAEDIECDVFAPAHNFPCSYVSKTQMEKGIRYDFRLYYNPEFGRPESHEINVPEHEQYQYINAVKNILENGEDKIDRTSTGTKGLFGGMMRYDLSSSFPLLTHKKVFWKGVLEELLFFIRGCTDARKLQQKGVHIWDGHCSSEYLKQIGLSHRRENDLGPVYGYQWRHWDAPYSDCEANYEGKGFDQIAWILNEIKHNPTSRRLILSAWNPNQLREMVLPPCHLVCQFQVSAKGALNCLMFQRSADMGLGVPFNIASYALLTCILAHLTGLKRGEFVHTMGDMHVYHNHISQLQSLPSLTPFAFPELLIDPLLTNIDDICAEHFTLKGYRSHQKIKMKMSV